VFCSLPHWREKYLITLKKFTTGKCGVVMCSVVSVCVFVCLSVRNANYWKQCVRLSQLLVGFRTHFKSLHFHFILARLFSYAGTSSESSGTFRILRSSDHRSEKVFVGGLSSIEKQACWNFSIGAFTARGFLSKLL